MADVLIVGAGVVGLSCAWQLALRGASVTVIDQGLPGREASWAGAGMLPPGSTATSTTPEARLRGASHELWPDLSAQLHELTGIDNGYGLCGGIDLACSADLPALQQELARWQAEGVPVERLDGPGLRQLAPAIGPAWSDGFWLPTLGQVRNPRHLKALLTACQQRGVRILSGTPCWGAEREASRWLAVQTPAGKLTAEQFLLATGAWTGGLARQTGWSLPIRPVRGQIALLRAEPLGFRQVLCVGSRYLVPRPDGRILVGSTEEDVGFEKRTTVEGISGLLDLAVEIVPELSRATLEQSWAGLRPCAPQGLPFLSRLPELDNVFVAAGHFRAGLQLSPITGVVMSQLLLGETPAVPLDAFSCGSRVE